MAKSTKSTKHGICICDENEDLLLAELRKVNKNAQKTTYRTYAQILGVVQEAETDLRNHNLSGKSSFGARFISVSGSAKPGAYDYKYACTLVVITKRHNGYWYLTTVDKYYRNAGKSADEISGLVITDKQRDIAMKRFLRGCVVTKKSASDRDCLAQRLPFRY